jgi:hypothetical protein
MGKADYVWIAYHDDWSGFVVFKNEVEALRHAVDHSMQVGRVNYGDDVRQTIEESKGREMVTHD